MMNYTNGTFETHKSFLQTSEELDFQISDLICLTLFTHLCTLVVILIGRLCSDLSHTCSEETCMPDVCCEINRRKGLIFFKEFILIIIPLVLSTTILSASVQIIVIIMLVISVTIILQLYFVHEIKTNFGTYRVQDILKIQVPDLKRSFVTCCRSLVNIMTVISILAVDFRIFPKKFSKTEQYGMSFMDYGVGFFILSNAAVLKLENIVNQGFRQCLVGCFVLFLLGVLRCVTLKEINYGVNVLEYGVHWNFFFTLAIVRLFTFIILYTFKSSFYFSGYLLCLFHQCLLSVGIEEYVLGNKPRENVIDANREGLVSTLGYTSLYLIGVSLNKFVLKKSIDVKGDLKAIAKVIVIGLFLYTISFIASPYYPPCRRVVNLTYITWVLTIAAANVAVNMCLELFVICFILPSTIKGKFYNFLTPLIFEAVNKNGLFFFLLGNILTGIVNISFSTKKLGGLQSILILLMYMLASCTIVTLMFFKKIVIKFW